MSGTVQFQGSYPYTEHTNPLLRQNQDRFFPGREWSSDIREKNGSYSWDIPNTSYRTADPDISRLFQRTRFLETKAPTNSPASPNPLSGVSHGMEKPTSFRSERQITEKRDIPSKRGIDNRIPMREQGESIENYFARAGGMEKTSYPKRYSMPQGRLADGVNAIYQPNGRWVSGENGLVFESGKIVGGEFVKDAPIYRESFSAPKRAASDKGPMLKDPVAERPTIDERSKSWDDLSSSQKRALMKEKFIPRETLTKKTEEAPRKAEEKRGWTCGGITTATIAAVAVVALAILAAGDKIDLKQFGLS